MITLYTWKTPNGRKPAIMLEETGLAHTVRPIDISADQQFDPAFLAIAPNNKIPAIVDDEAPGGEQSLFESGAILTYLAAKSGRLLPPEGPAHWSVLTWLHWSIGGLGPMLGQLNFFAIRSNEKAPLAIDRFTKEAKRLLGVMEKRLTETPYKAGGEYSIADIASYPWVHAARTGMGAVLGDTFEASPATLDWLARIGERPAVAKGMKVLED
jgi:GST-like protein